MELKTVKLDIPEETNCILGQTHFIKSIEDLYEALADSAPTIKFGIAFCEASGPCLIRTEGNDENLIQIAAKNAMKIGAGHSFVIHMKNGYPINVLNRIKLVPEVCGIFCATANPVEIIVTTTEQGNGILGVIDGFSPKGIEGEQEKKERKEFLRKIGYKL
ncbi:adenosine-specific kinase [Candidatus Borrarchaeum sp.]|uniref:adenosine-specific kinase n=1 Tax=Candidatus Borrarchaeum sp. TaxID=2846742 RepID=UPI00257E5F56|nr:adenosine-specific kinase [Candidatus Borrarchaeum sp.]